LLDREGRVTAVLCPRSKFVAVSPVPKPRTPAYGQRSFVPYNEKVRWRIHEDDLDSGKTIVRELVT
jgi:hypothetical protein